ERKNALAMQWILPSCICQLLKGISFFDKAVRKAEHSGCHTILHPNLPDWEELALWPRAGDDSADRDGADFTVPVRLEEYPFCLSAPSRSLAQDAGILQAGHRAGVSR
ncbi:MAG: hypothetical protein NZ804_12935, partial [Roseibacillus sp.]|nr:hypothetical protein [Roseibacillus sp.]